MKIKFRFLIFLLFLFSNIVNAQSPPTVNLNFPTQTEFSTGVNEKMTISWTSTNQHHYGIYLWKGNEEIAIINSPWSSSARSYIWTVPQSVTHHKTNETLVSVSYTHLTLPTIYSV